MRPEQLKASSQRWMTAALSAFSQGPGSYDFAVHHAGIAAEHLLKAYLAALHPALIVEAKDFDSMLHATGHGVHALAPASRAKTIGLVEAHARVHKILRKQIPIDQRALAPVANARNGVAHSGIHDVAEVQTVFTTCLRLIDPLLTELKVDPKTYWGSYEQLHDMLIAKQVEKARIQMESMLAKARAIFQQRYSHLAPKEREVVLAAIASQGPRVVMEHEAKRRCPACDSPGWLAGDTSWGEVDDHSVLVVTPHIFTCSACDLEVEGEQLSHLRGLAEEFHLDPADYWEPDEDWLRGR
ncbi:hypothetical protein ACIQ7Q_33740 [Streptomyces sp. NPDC096176]|uniref:hypothetical protein n=1 Tax=Streptomyces sp. NPDC096176 TaxID=3366079 RepID=UPI0038221A1E